MHDYIPRVVDSEIARSLERSGALVIYGARAVGKTESARQVASSELRLDSAEPRAVLARQQPSVALEGNAPRLLDEWQLVPELWNEVRHAVDDRRTNGQFILSGSAVPDDNVSRHSGAGRFRRVTMRTLSLAESGESTGQVSIEALLAGEDVPIAESDTRFDQVIRRIVTGGWPGWLDQSEEDASARSASYIDDISQHDFVQVAGSRRDPRRLTAYLRALAALTAQPATFAAMVRRMADDASIVAGHNAAPLLHHLAERLFLIEDQPAWSPRLRSRTSAVQTPKRHLVDPSLAAALLGARSRRLLAEPDTLGFLFESQVVHDLRVYAQQAGARGVFHFRDTKGRDEIDAVVEGDDGGWLAIEAKLGAAAVDAAAANLHRVTAKMARPPVAKVVIVPSGLAHRRTDGVDVIPLAVLGP